MPFKPFTKGAPAKAAPKPVAKNTGKTVPTKDQKSGSGYFGC